MRVIKRDGSHEDVSFDKVLRRIQVQCKDLHGVDPHNIAQKVCTRIYDGVKTSELDELAAQMCASLVTEHPDYGILASRLIVSNHHKNTSPSFSETMAILYHAKDVHNKHTPRISNELWEIVQAYKEKLNSVIDYERDFGFDYFGFKTLERSYLIKVDGRAVERPQHMWMRVALGIHGWDVKDAIETYQLMSTRQFTHATPTLFNAGTPRPQLSSCFIKGTMVYTSEGGKPIEDVKIGDLVLTHKGRFQKVSQLHVNNLVGRHLIDFKAYCTPKITATNNHGFMSLTSEQIQWGKEPQWNTLESLRVGDYIEVPNHVVEDNEVIIDVFEVLSGVLGDGNNISYEYTVTNDVIECTSTWKRENHLRNGSGEITFTKKQSQIHRNWVVDESFCRFMGIWYGDGHIVKQKNSARILVPKGIGITVDKRNTEVIEFVEDYGESLFGIKPCIHNMSNQSVCQILFNSTMIGHVFQKMFGEYFHGKFLNPMFHTLSTSHVKALLSGLVTSDGFITSKGMVRVGMCNPKFVKDVYMLARSRSIVVSYSETFKTYRSTVSGEAKDSQTAYMSIPKESACLNFVSKTYEDDRIAKFNNRESNPSCVLKLHGKTFVRIMSKTPSSDDSTVVYNLGVEEDHSYVVEGIVAKNCFLISMEDDSISGIYNTLGDVAEISKNAGGVGLHIHQIRSTGSHIRGTNGESTGVIPMLRVFNATARYVNQGGKRNGSIAVYLEPSHPDFEKFLDLRKNHGNMEERCLDLFTAAWLPDLFMRRVEANADWSFFCPDECPGLCDVYGEEYDRLYDQYEREGKAKKTIKAQHLFMSIVKSQIETGTPYILYKDACNRKSNQKNLGTIKSSNLCVEVVEYSSPDETAVCNLASIALPAFVEKDENGKPFINYDKLHHVTGVVTKNLCKVIDRNFYPTPKTERSNMRHRPIGIGVQGLADMYALMRVPFDSEEASELNKKVFETMYHGALTASMLIAKKRDELRVELDNEETSEDRKNEIRKHLHMTAEEESLQEYRGAYTTFKGSPAQQGQLQFDLWNAKPFGQWDWDTLKADIMKYGIRNSLLLAPMPTASTSQILGYNECFEPFTSNIYQRRTLAGEFTIINKYLIRDLIEIGVWNIDLKNRILLGNGSIQHIQEIPEDIRALYKTSWELKQKVLIDQAADRGVYICQSQSLNLFVEDPEFNKLSNMHFYSWKKGLKTGMYYLRTRPKAKTMAFSIDATTIGNSVSPKKPTEEVFVCRRDDPTCTMCSS
jgi:ribonucleoside-diphosphate reductase alpha chain